MKVLKWSKINAVDGSGALREENRKRVCKNIGKYIVDDSKFVPISELVKRNVEVGNTTFTQSEIKTSFDYPEGYKNGKSKEINIEGRKSGKNRAELSTQIHEKEMEVKAEIEKQMKLNEKMKKFEERTAVKKDENNDKN